MRLAGGIGRRSWALLLFMALVISLTMGGYAFAQTAREVRSFTHSPGGERSSSRVSIGVRVVHAVERIDDLARNTSVPIRIDSRLEDLADKLKKLPFRSFSLMTNVKRDVSVLRKAVFPLISGQTLIVRPLYCEAQKVGLWLRWLDANETEILDTRVHFTSGESMIAGTDLTSNPKNAIILAMEVKPSAE